MDIRLVITNIGFLFGIVLNIAVTVWVLKKSGRNASSIILAVLNTVIIVFQVGHLLGINSTDSVLSRDYFNMTLAVLFIPPLASHWILSVLNQIKDRKVEIYLMYALTSVILSVFVAWPESYLNISINKLYLPNYYDAGALFWMLPALFALVAVSFMYHTLLAYKDATPILKNRLKYFVVTFFLGYGVGSTAFFLAYDIPVDPIWAAFLSLYTIPLAYGIVRFELMDIAIIAKRALVYGSLVVGVSMIITAISYINLLLSERVAGFPLWFIPLLSSFFAVAIGALVWVRLKEVDVLKYEFITIIIHKFRTPLTRIHWSSEELKHEVVSENGKRSLYHIDDAGRQLTQLTDVLINISEAERPDYDYKFNRVDLKDVLEEQLSMVRGRFKEKGIVLNEEHPDKSVYVYSDEKRLQFVVEVLLDNAYSYTQSGGLVSVKLFTEGNRSVLCVRDNGIGITREELPKIFTKFYRNAKAKTSDTEGLGIGLYLSRKIIDRHGGHLTAESEGESKGAAFTVSLPLVK